MAAVALTAILVVLASAVGATGATVPSSSDEIGGGGGGPRATAQALQSNWIAAVATAGGVAGSPIVFSAADYSLGDPISGVFYTAPDGTTASVERTRYTPGSTPTLVGPSTNPGTAECVSNGTGNNRFGAGLQGNAPRPTTLTGGIFGVPGCPFGYSYGEFGGAGESTTRDAVEFSFSRPVLAFGAWFGDLETRTDGFGVAALVRLYGAGGVLLSEQEVEPGPRYVTAPNSQASCTSTYTGCGNNTTRWVGFVADPAEPVERMVVIVGDQVAGGDALDEGMGFIGPTFDLSEASIALTKTADPLTDTNGDLMVGAGDTVSYDFAVENTGTLAVTTVTIVDTLATGLSCPGGSLAAGNTITCTGSHVLTQAEVDAGTLANTAYATAAVYGGTIESNTSSVTTAIPAIRSLTVVKTVDVGSDTFDAVGDVLAFTVVATNTGNVTLTGVSVTDTAPGAGAFDATACASVPTTLAPGASATCAVTYTVTQADLDGGGVINTASASGTAPGAVAVGPTSGSASSVAVQSSSLSLIKTVDAATYSSVGQTLTYTLTLRNTGNVSLDDIEIDDTAPGAGALDASDCTALDGSSLAPLADVQCTVTYVVTQADLNTGSLTNLADATAKNPLNVAVIAPQASVTSTATTTSSLSITKVVDALTYDEVGDLLTFTVTVTNVGTVTLDGVGVTDSGPGVGDCAALSVTLNPTESAQCVVTYAVDQNDLNQGSVSNTAFATATDPGGGPVVSTDASAQSDAIQAVSLTVLKTATEASFDSVGDVLNFTITATNTGNVSLTSVDITDLAPGAGAFALDCSALQTALDPTDSTNCTATYAVTQADLNDGAVNNTAGATAETTTGAPVTAPDSTLAIPAVQLVSLTLSKSVAQPDFAALGDQLDYTLTATNAGNVTLTSVVIADAAPGSGAFVTTCAVVLATLAPTQTVDCAATYDIDQADLDNGSVTNTATASGLTPNNDPASSGAAQATSNAVQSVQLVLTKTANRSSFGAVGELITFSLAIANAGNVTVDSVTISDPAPGTGAFTSTCPFVLATLAPGGSASCTSTYTVTASDISAGQITSVAVGQGLVPPAPAVVVSNVELITLAFIEPSLATTGTSVVALGSLSLVLLGLGVAIVLGRRAGRRRGQRSSTV